MTTEGHIENAAPFLTAGRALFTVLNERTGNRFTFKVTERRPREGETFCDQGPTHNVGVLTGPDNEDSYTYLGSIWQGVRFGHSSRSPIAPSAQSSQVFRWFWARALRGDLPEFVKVFHAGRCGRCGRTLTDPESIATGLGPICRGRSV